MAGSDKYSWDRISELYSMALELPAKEWENWLLTQCSDQERNNGLDTYLLKLLKNSPRAEAFFDDLNENLEKDLGRNEDMEIYKPGDKFDKFIIRKEIGHGGMSKVFLCDRADGQFEQKVAIKVMKVGGDVEFMKDRFRQEQQILAGINHPHIARLYDGGITSEGHPYIVMEYVEGEAIDSYCSRKKLGVKERIRLFRQVCDALQYAHSKLIVHHDIKPANILVNEQGQVRLLDFGISQILFSQEMEEARKTSFEGTLQYASPEQFDGAGPSVASDIYKLGLVLYNLLTGKHYSFKENTSGFRDVLYESQNYGLLLKKPFRKNSLLLSDLDAVLRMCLATDPQQRFDSVSALSHDLQNTLSNYTLHSHAPGMWYRLRKTYARNKAKVWMASLFNLALIISFVFLTSQYQQTLVEKQRAENILEFVWDIFESADPEMAGGDTLNVYALLENSIPRIQALDNQPELQAELFYETGRIYTKMGFWNRGGELYYAAMEIAESLPQKRENHISRARILTDIAVYHRNMSEHVLADSIIDLALEILQRYPRAVDFNMLAHAIRVKSDAKRLQGHHEESIELNRKVIALIEQNTSDPTLEKVAANANLGNSYRHMGQYDQALYYMEKAMQMIDEMEPGISSIKLTTYGDYAILLGDLGKHEEALEIRYRTYEIQAAVYGQEAPITLVSLFNLGSIYFNMENYQKADSINLYILDHFRRIFGDYHNYTVSTLFNLSNSYFSQGQYDRALEFQKLVLEADIENMGKNHPFVAGTLRALGRTYMSMNQMDKAEELFYQALDVYRHNFGEQHRFISVVYSFLAAVNCRKGNYLQCSEYYDIALEMAIETVGEDHQTTQNIRRNKEQYASELAGIDS